jgi:hypothetical protein
MEFVQNNLKVHFVHFFFFSFFFENARACIIYLCNFHIDHYKYIMILDLPSSHEYD